MIVRKMRLARGWSQEDLATLSGLSVRTIQRIEGGQKPGLESAKCLAAVFETDVANMMQEQKMANHEHSDGTDLGYGGYSANEYNQNVKGFGLHVLTIILVLPALYFMNLELSPGELWVKWVALLWGVGFALHALTMLVLFGWPGKNK